MSFFNDLNNDTEKSVHSGKKITWKYFHSFLDCVLDIFFPSVCPGCGKNVIGGQAVCSSCFENIPINKSLFCGKCGARLPASQPASPSLGGRGKLENEADPPSHEATEGYSPAIYPRRERRGILAKENKKICHFDFPYILGAATTYKNETAQALVKELKFGFIKNAARPLAELLIAYTERIGFVDGDWLVVPIPLGKKRLRQRGFNQAAVIAEIFAEHFSLAVEKDGFVRNKETKPQTEMKNFESRIENAGGCFSVIAPEKFVGRNIILIDDVSTSGATFLEAASELKHAGAKKIIALAVAKG